MTPRLVCRSQAHSEESLELFSKLASPEDVSGALGQKSSAVWTVWTHIKNDQVEFSGYFDYTMDLILKLNVEPFNFLSLKF